MLSQMALLRFQILPFNYLFLQIPWVPSLGWEDPLENRKAQDSGLENFIDYIVHEVAKSQTRLSNLHFD